MTIRTPTPDREEEKNLPEKRKKKLRKEEKIIKSSLVNDNASDKRRFLLGLNDEMIIERESSPMTLSKRPRPKEKWVRVSEGVTDRQGTAGSQRMRPGFSSLASSFSFPFFLFPSVSSPPQ